MTIIKKADFIDSIADKGLFHKNKAARHKSRLSAKVKALDVVAVFHQTGGQEAEAQGIDRVDPEAGRARTPAAEGRGRAEIADRPRRDDLPAHEETDADTGRPGLPAAVLEHEVPDECVDDRMAERRYRGDEQHGCSAAGKSAASALSRSSSGGDPCTPPSRTCSDQAR